MIRSYSEYECQYGREIEFHSNPDGWNCCIDLGGHRRTRKTVPFSKPTVHEEIRYVRRLIAEYDRGGMARERVLMEIGGFEETA